MALMVGFFNVVVIDNSNAVKSDLEKCSKVVSRRNHVVNLAIKGRL